MDFEKQLIIYYKGEWLEAALLAAFGVTMAGLSVVMWQYANQNALIKGLFYPIAFLAIFTALAGSYGVYNNGQRLAVMPVQYAQSPSAFIEAEKNRFDATNGVNSWWVLLKVLWAALAVAGILLSFFTRSDLTHGVAIGLIIIGAMGFLIDGFAHHRSSLYTLALQTRSAAQP